MTTPRPPSSSPVVTAPPRIYLVPAANVTITAADLA